MSIKLQEIADLTNTIEGNLDGTIFTPTSGESFEVTINEDNTYTSPDGKIWKKAEEPPTTGGKKRRSSKRSSKKSNRSSKKSKKAKRSSKKSRKH